MTEFQYILSASAMVATVILIIVAGVYRGNVYSFIKDPLGVKNVVNNINSKASFLHGELLHSHKKIEELHNAVKHHEDMYREYKFHKMVTDSLDSSSPDMMWAKDIYGRYVIANKKIRDGLLFDDKPYGKTDVQLSKAQKERVGSKNHTFGEVCGDSDKLVLDTERPQRFVEWGIVNGTMLILEVHKNVIRDSENNIIGTCGVARDITTEYKGLKEIADKTDCEDTRRAIMIMIDRYKFKNKEHDNG